MRCQCVLRCLCRRRAVLWDSQSLYSYSCWSLPSGWRMSSQRLRELHRCESSGGSTATSADDTVLRLWSSRDISFPLFSCRSEMRWRSKWDLPVTQLHLQPRYYTSYCLRVTVTNTPPSHACTFAGQNLEKNGNIKRLNVPRSAVIMQLLGIKKSKLLHINSGLAMNSSAPTVAVFAYGAEAPLRTSEAKKSAGLFDMKDIFCHLNTF